MRLYLYLTFLLLALFMLKPFSALAQEQTVENKTVDPPKPDMRSVKGLIPAPVLYYTPDTKFGFGASLLGYFRLRSYTDTTYTRLSLARVIGIDRGDNRGGLEEAGADVVVGDLGEVVVGSLTR